MILPMPGSLAIPAQGRGLQKTKKTLMIFGFLAEKPKNTKVFWVFCNPPPCAGMAKLPGMGKIIDF